MTGDPLPYQKMVEDAMRGVVRAALREAAENGLPGDHHFYVSFLPQAPGVEIPAPLRAQYPEEMTVVLQHQFWNLEVGEEAFTVELAFGGRRYMLRVPFAAVTGFLDPSVEFGLQFPKPGAAAPAGAAVPGPGGGTGDTEKETEPPAGETAAGDADGKREEAGGEKVVSIETFRKK